MLPLAVILTVVLPGCRPDGERPENEGSQSAFESVMIGVDGGVFTAMEGNVEITVPEGALTVPTTFVVHDLMNRSSGNPALKPIFIEPLVEFAKPVQLALKYDGCLENGINVCAAKSILFSIWDDEAAFIGMLKPEVCSQCDVNVDSHMICMSICRTGLIVTTAEL